MIYLYNIFIHKIKKHNFIFKILNKTIQLNLIHIYLLLNFLKIPTLKKFSLNTRLKNIIKFNYMNRILFFF